jgi:hypothetical protein
MVTVCIPLRRWKRAPSDDEIEIVKEEFESRDPWADAHHDIEKLMCRRVVWTNVRKIQRSISNYENNAKRLNAKDILVPKRRCG